MPSVKVDAKNLGNVLKKHFADKQELLKKASLAVAYQGQAYAVTLTNQEGLVYLGVYKRGWMVRPRPGKGAELRNDTPYGPVIEYGRRPNRPGPPIDPIREWVRIKLGLSGDELERAAWAIRNAIHRRGTRPKFVMRRTYERMKLWFRAEAERRLRAGR